MVLSAQWLRGSICTVHGLSVLYGVVIAESNICMIVIGHLPV